MTAPETWDLGVEMLKAQGHKEGVARAFIGSLLVDYDEADVVNALQAAVGKADAKGYVRKVLKSCKQRGRKIQDRLVEIAPPPAKTEIARAAIRQGIAVLKGRAPCVRGPGIDRGRPEQERGARPEESETAAVAEEQGDLAVARDAGESGPLYVMVKGQWKVCGRWTR